MNWAYSSRGLDSVMAERRHGGKNSSELSNHKQEAESALGLGLGSGNFEAHLQ